jgi:hypothetical protein
MMIDFPRSGSSSMPLLADPRLLAGGNIFHSEFHGRAGCLTGDMYALKSSKQRERHICQIQIQVRPSRSSP